MSLVKSFIAVTAIVSICFFASDALAQGRRGAKGKGGADAKSAQVVKIKEMTKPDKSCLVPSPSFEGKVKGPNRKAGNKKRWAALEVDYVTQEEWLDEVTFTFHVLSRDEKKVPLYFTVAVSYLDIAKGEHGACVMLPPSAVARYGTPVAFGVEVEYDGNPVAGDSVGMGAGTDWWNKIGDQNNLVTHSGILVDRSKTPFGLTFIDEYEVVR